MRTVWMVAMVVMMYWAQHAAPLQMQTECPGVTIVRNGLAAFDSGVTQIGPYTDRESYRTAGLDYIWLRCGIDDKRAFDAATR